MYLLTERCKAKARTGNASASGQAAPSAASERQQIIAELQRLGAHIRGVRSYADDFNDILADVPNLTIAKKVISSYPCILDGFVYMKNERRVQPNVRLRWDQYIAHWNDGYLGNFPEQFKVEVKKHVLRLLLF